MPSSKVYAVPTMRDDGTTDIAIIGGGPACIAATKKLAQLAKAGGLHVTCIHANEFIEWSIGATIFLCDPSKHSSLVSGNPRDNQLPGIASYLYGAVTALDASKKTITIGGDTTVRYKAVIIATGSYTPLFVATPGHTFSQRQQEVAAFGAAVGQADASSHTAVVNGAGLLGLELAGDLRVAHPQLRIVLLSRSGKLQQHGSLPQDLVAPITARLAKMRIQLVKGTVTAIPSGGDPLQPILTPGSLVLSDTDGGPTELTFGVYVPAFAQGPNTRFLPSSALDDQKCLRVDEHLHSIAFKGLFGVNVVPPPPPELSHPSLAVSQAKAELCAVNAVHLVRGEPLVARDARAKKGGPYKLPFGAYPIRIHVGHGKGGFLFWSDLMANEPMMLCCCQPCKGGFPICPPPCCWCMGQGCPMLCGYCCGPNASEGAVSASGYQPAPGPPCQMQ